MAVQINNTEAATTAQESSTAEISSFETIDGMRFTVRPIRPEDEALLADFHGRLSEDSVYRRYFVPMKLETRVAHERLLRRCRVDGHEQVALVAEHTDSAGAPHIAGVARLARIPGGNSAELAFVVADQYQHRGLGNHLLHQMIEIGRQQGLLALEAEVLADNYTMRSLFRRAGFDLSTPAEGVLRARLVLGGDPFGMQLPFARV